jgi:alpha-amylase
MLLLGVLCLTLVKPAAAQDELPWWNDRVFYEIFVRSFYDSDGDGIGDLQGVIEKLDYLNDGDPTTTTDLGITGIWLMPIMQSPSYHGYDVTDYRQVEVDYGTNEDFRRLMEEAHARGIAVVIDLVINHSSAQHPWFDASARENPHYADWYVWSEDDPGYRGPSRQQVWHGRAGRYYYGVFWDQMPDFNLTNPEVTAELENIARYWLDDMGADGFRVDAVKHLIEEGEEQENTASTMDWMSDFNASIDDAHPDALVVGEIWSTNYTASQYVRDASDIVFDFDLATAFLSSVQQGRPDGVRSLLDRALDLYPFGQYASFLTNHDQNRVMTQLREDVDAAKVAASLLLTTPGVPFLYYGEEIGMTGQKPDELIRTPMQWENTEDTAGFTSGRPWQPVSNGYEAVNVAAQIDDPNSLLSHYRSLIQLRNQRVALRTGAYVPLEAGSRQVFAFLRQTDDETLLIVINMDDRDVDEYGIDLSSVSDADEAELLYATHDVELLTGEEDGLYRLGEVLPARSTVIFRLS